MQDFIKDNLLLGIIILAIVALIVVVAICVIINNKSIKNNAINEKNDKSDKSVKDTEIESRNKSISKELDNKDDNKSKTQKEDLHKNEQIQGSYAEISVSAPAYRVKYDKDKKDWVVKKDGASRATRRFSTKSEATKYANGLSKGNGSKLSVHKKNGQFQKLK